jgi:hypothetical protein
MTGRANVGPFFLELTKYKVTYRGSNTTSPIVPALVPHYYNFVHARAQTLSRTFRHLLLPAQLLWRLSRLDEPALLKCLPDRYHAPDAGYPDRATKP